MADLRAGIKHFSKPVVANSFTADVATMVARETVAMYSISELHAVGSDDNLGGNAKYVINALYSRLLIGLLVFWT